MGSWYYVWENGDVSFVSAPNKDEAIYVLDEIESADPKRLKPMGAFFVGFTHKGKPKEDEFKWKPDGDISEEMIGILANLEDEAYRRQQLSDEEVHGLNILSVLDLEALPSLKGFDLKKEFEKISADHDFHKNAAKNAMEVMENYAKKKQKMTLDALLSGSTGRAFMGDVAEAHRLWHAKIYLLKAKTRKPKLDLVE